MINIEFKDFWKIIEKEKLNNYISIVHASIQNIGIIFMTKTKEDINYYTYIYYEDIALFAENNNLTFDESFERFKINYLTNVQLFKDYNLLPSIPIIESEEPQPEEIETETITKPKPVEDCVDSLLADPNFKAYPGKTREETAYAICYSRYNKSKKTNCDCSNQHKITPNTNEILKEILYKDNDIDAGSDMIEESKDYSGFLLGFFNKLENKVLTAVSKLDDEIIKDYSKDIKTKTLGDFLKDLFNIVNTKFFISNVRKYLKMDLLKGMYEAEKETKIDIGFTDNYQAKLNQLASQQLDGYTINGKKWFGIKGVTKEIQQKVIKTVQDGINKELSLKEIKDNVKDTFEVFSDWRANMIARTETNRIINESKILGYKETGIKGIKKWSAAIDSRTSPICKRLNGMKVGLDDNFIDPETNKSYFTPPSHPSCRSVVVFIPS